VKPNSEYCEPFATKQMRPERLARKVKTPVLVFYMIEKSGVFMNSPGQLA